MTPRRAGLAAALALAACGAPPPGREARASGPAPGPAVDAPLEVSFGVIGFDSPRQTRLRYRGLMDALDARAPFAVSAIPGRNESDLMAFVEERTAELVPLEPLSYLRAHAQFGAVPLVAARNRAGEPVARSAFVTSEASALRALGDLAGRRLALGRFHSTLGNLVPRAELQRAGLEPGRLAELAELDDAEAVLAAVRSGRYDAGAVDERLAEESGLRVLHRSAPIPGPLLAVRADLPRHVAEPLRAALLAVEPAPEGEPWQELLGYGFAPARDEDYAPVRELVERVTPGCTRDCHEPLGELPWR